MSEIIATLFLQLSVILIVCRFFAFIGNRYFGQTDVVCEMVAGIALGPTLLGLFFPTAQHWLFSISPTHLANGTSISNPSMTVLFALSQLGLVVFMFLIGIEFDSAILKKRFKAIGSIVGAGTIVPFILSCLATLFLYQKSDFFEPDISMITAMLFLGICISMTAFPLLARILYEQNLSKTSFGGLALAAGSIGDVIGWCLLAVMLATIHENIHVAYLTILGGIVYTVCILAVGRKILKKLLSYYEKYDSKISILAYILVIVMMSALITDKIGIHAIFGAFIIGVVMPHGRLTDQIQKKLEPLTVTFLLPIFFVYSGLNTQLALINTIELWIITGGIIFIAIFGKFVACTLTAKLAGETWQDAATIGTLMNARGLMELIVLNIGLEYKIITPTLFSVMVVMTLVTTLMTSPLFNLIQAKNIAAKKSGKTVKKFNETFPHFL